MTWRDYSPGEKGWIRGHVKNMIHYYAPDDWFEYAPYDPTVVLKDTYWDTGNRQPSAKALEIVKSFNGRVCEGLGVNIHTGMWIDFETQEDMVAFKLYWL